MRWWVRRKNVLLVICVLVLCVLLQLKDALALRSPIDVLCYRTWKDSFCRISLLASKWLRTAYAAVNSGSSYAD
jgi:hypothetical protein